MKTSKWFKPTTFVVIMSFLFTILVTPSVSFAGWHKQYDLPGESDEEMLTSILLIVGAAVAVYLIIKLADTDDEAVEDETGKELEKGAKQDSLSTSFKSHLLNDHRILTIKKAQLSNTFENGISVRPIFGLKNNSHGLRSMTPSNPFENPVLTLGVKVRF